MYSGKSEGEVKLPCGVRSFGWRKAMPTWQPDDLADTEDTGAYFDAAGLGPEGLSDE